MGKPSELPLLNPSHATALIAHDLSPADAIHFKQSAFAAFVTDVGGATSHTAIVARSLGLPAVAGLEHVTSLLATGDLVVMDGGRGLVVLEPDAETIRRGREEEQRRQAMAGELDRYLCTSSPRPWTATRCA